MFSKEFNSLLMKEDIEKITLFYKTGIKLEASYCHSTLFYKKITSFKWLIENGCPIDQLVYECIVINEDLMLMIWLTNRRPLLDRIYLLELASSRGSLGLVKWLYSCIYHNGDFLKKAIENGKLNVLSCFIEERGYALTPALLDLIAKTNHFYMIEYAHRKVPSYDWGCQDGLCKLCNIKSDLIIEMSHEKGNYLDWLSNNLIESITY